MGVRFLFMPLSLATYTNFSAPFRFSLSVCRYNFYDSFMLRYFMDRLISFAVFLQLSHLIGLSFIGGFSVSIT